MLVLNCDNLIFCEGDLIINYRLNEDNEFFFMYKIQLQISTVHCVMHYRRL